MNQSKKWMVRHEPGKFGDGPETWHGHPLVADPKMVSARLCRREYYGEVNSYLRHVLLELPVERRGVILRDPGDILVSVVRRRVARKLPQWRMDVIALGYVALDQALQSGSVIPIRFERMTTDAAYLQNVLEAFGIKDVQVSKETLARKVNASKCNGVKGYADVPDATRRYYEAQTGWYREKYYAAKTIQQVDG